MATRILLPGAKVADAAFPNAAFPAQLAEDGFEAFCGYNSSPTNNPKNWNAQRYEWFGDIGCGQFCEQSETIVLSGYSAANLALGRQCEQMANDFGVPDDVPMWYAVDISPFAYFTEIKEAFRAYKDTNHRPIGAYAGSQCIDMLMDEGLVEYGHIPSAASWSETTRPQNGDDVVYGYTSGGRVHNMYISPRAHMRQFPSIPYAGSRIDPNVVLREVPFWVPNAVDPVPDPDPEPTPEPEEITENDEMLIVLLGDVNGWWKGLQDNGYARSIYAREAQIRMEVSTATKVPIPYKTIPEAEWAAWADAPPAPAGARGVAGPAGPTGATGPQGPAGTAGAPGATPHGTFTVPATSVTY